MSNSKISALTAATTPLAGTEVLPIVQSGVTKQVSVANLTAGRAVSADSLTLTGSPLPATSGGTGQSSYAVGDLLYASSTTALSKLADVATGNALISGGVGVAPSWGKIGLTTHVSGTLPVGNGGTGATTFTAGRVLFGNGSSAINTSANLFWDNTNNFLGVNTTSPTTQGSFLYGSGGANINVQSRAHFGGTYSSNSLVLGYSVKADPTANDRMVGTETNSGGGAPAAILMNSGIIQFHTATSITSGAAFSSQRMQIGASGGVSIGNTTDPGAGNLSVTGSATIQTLTIGLGANAVSTNTALGYTVLPSATGGLNTASGYLASQSVTSGTDNVSSGYSAGRGVTTGSGNVCIGSQAGYNSTNVVTGNRCIHIGYATIASATNASDELVIGTNQPTGKGGSTGFINPAGGGVYQGNNSSSWSTTSDQRLKKNIVDNNIGLEIIKAIQVRNFEYRLPEEVDPELKPSDAIDRQGIQLGVIAQELQAVLPECVKQESTGVLSVDSDNLTWYLINAVKQLSAEIENLKSQVKG